MLLQTVSPDGAELLIIAFIAPSEHPVCRKRFEFKQSSIGAFCYWYYINMCYKQLAPMGQSLSPQQQPLHKWWEATTQMVGSNYTNGGKQLYKWWEATI